MQTTCCVLPLQGPEAVKTYLREANDIGFDALELDTGRVVLEPNEELQLVEDVHKVQSDLQKWLLLVPWTDATCDLAQLRPGWLQMEAGRFTAWLSP